MILESNQIQRWWKTELVHITNRPKKRKIVGRLKEKLKKQKLSNHTKEPDCKCTRFKWSCNRKW